ncbi:MAG: hypothetical protein ACRETU_11380 [Steroidobacterales bacterium]
MDRHDHLVRLTVERQLLNCVPLAAHIVRVLDAKFSLENPS